MEDLNPRHQNIRKQRVAMTTGSYLFTFVVLCTSSLVGFLPAVYLAFFLVATVVVNGAFWLIFHFRLNRHFADPNLTLLQMLVSLVPPLYVMVFLENNQARSALMLVSMVPLLYGILGLTTRSFGIAALGNIAGYLITLSVIAIANPGLIEWRAELVMIAALSVVMVQMASIGGYISKLRHKLKKKNDALNEAFKRIQEIASQDELTGTFNRRHLLEQVAKEYERCHRGAPPFSIILLDLDHFKQINDTFGHLAGDEVLRQCTQAWNVSLRHIDTLGRYGGEEFLVLLPQTTLEGACIKAERLRELVASLDFSGVSSRLKVTTSCGVATFTGQESYWDTIDRADQALYIAKQKGRNQTHAEALSAADQTANEEVD